MRTASLLEYLRSRCPVDSILFRQAGDPDPAAGLPSGLARRVLVLELPRHSKSPPARAVRNLSRFVRGVPPLTDRFSGFTAEVERFVSGRRYALSVIEHFWCAPYAGVLEACSERLVLDLHNVESALMASRAAAASGGAAALFRRFERAGQRLERRWLPRFHTLLATSDADAALLRPLAPGSRILVYPNSIPLTPVPARPEQHVIAFSGNLEYDPNLDAVRHFHARIWPLLAERWPSLVWRIVGRHPEAVRRLVSGDPRIEVTGEVADAVEALAPAAAVVVPLRIGSGTRVKILEAWAARRAVVSTPLGAEGLGARDGEHLLVAQEPREFATAVSTLLESAPLRDHLGASGRRYYESRFTWEAAWAALDAAGLR